VQKTAQSLASLADIDVSATRGIADIDTVKAATTARTIEKRIVCGDVIGGSIKFNGSRKTPHLALYAEYWWRKNLFT
jgi:hypothetical protein